MVYRVHLFACFFFKNVILILSFPPVEISRLFRPEGLSLRKVKRRRFRSHVWKHGAGYRQPRGEMDREALVTGVHKDLRLLRMNGLVNGCIRA